MEKAFKELLKQPFWIIALILGVVLEVLPCVTIDKDWHFSTHPPTTYWLVWIGITLLLVSIASFAYTLYSKQSASVSGADAGLNYTHVKESNGIMWTMVGDCEIRVANGRLEDYSQRSAVTIAMPCNEYFDICVDHPKSALGSFVNRVFVGQTTDFQTIVENECRRKLGKGTQEQRSSEGTAISFGPGKCVLLVKPLGRSFSVALVSTSIQRAGLGLSSRISYLVDGVRELVTNLADTRTSNEEVVMPVLGGGNAGISPQLALVATLLAVAEAARYGQGGQRPKIVTIVMFQPDANGPASIDPTVVRRALALISSLD